MKSFEVTEVPVRAARFVVRKSWVVTGSVSCSGRRVCTYVSVL